MSKVIAGYVRALYPHLQTARACTMYVAPIGPEMGVREGETCAVNYRTTSAHRWATRTVEPAPVKVVEIASVGVCVPASHKAPVWTAVVGPMLMVGTAILCALMGARHGDITGYASIVGMLSFTPMARLSVSSWSEAEEDAVFSSPYPPLHEVEVEHGFTGEGLMVDYACAHAPTYEAGLRVCDHYTDMCATPCVRCGEDLPVGIEGISACPDGRGCSDHWTTGIIELGHAPSYPESGAMGGYGGYAYSHAPSWETACRIADLSDQAS